MTWVFHKSDPVEGSAGCGGESAEGSAEDWLELGVELLDDSEEDVLLAAAAAAEVPAGVGEDVSGGGEGEGFSGVLEEGVEDYVAAAVEVRVEEDVRKTDSHGKRPQTSAYKMRKDDSQKRNERRIRWQKGTCG